MQMPTFTFILLFTFLTATYTYSQVPGYQGKRLNISYDANFNYNALKLLKPLGLSFNDKPYTPPKFNIKNGIGVEYVLGHNSSISLKTSIYKGKVTYKDALSAIYYYNYYYGYYDYDYVDVTPYEEANIFGYQLGLYYRFYHPKKGLAPLGNYLELGFERMGYRINNPSTKSKLYYNYYYGDDYFTTTTDDFFTIQNPYAAYFATIGVGTQKVIYQNLSIRYGVKLGWLLGSGYNVLEGFYGDYGNGLTSSNYYKYESRKNLFSRNLFNFDIGIGYLISTKKKK
jgi:hypothetical protein